MFFGVFLCFLMFFYIIFVFQHVLLTGWITHPFLTNRRLFNFRLPDTRRVWRWEQAVYFSQTNPWAQSWVGVLVPDNYWQSLAQDREIWCQMESTFVRLHAVNPRSEQIALEDVYANALLEIPDFVSAP